MSLLADAELALLRSDFAAAVCDLPCQIERASITYPVPGNAVTTWPVISAPTLLCGMTEPSAGQLTNYDYMIGDEATWHIRFPFGTDVKELDRLLITDKDGTVITLSVKKKLKPRSYAALVSALATE